MQDGAKQAARSLTSEPSEGSSLHFANGADAAWTALKGPAAAFLASSLAQYSLLVVKETESERHQGESPGRTGLTSLAKRLQNH